MENTVTYEIMEKEIINPSDIPEPVKVQKYLEKIRSYQQIVQRQLISGIDYGQTGNNQKPTLLKPGAEKLMRLHGLIDKYEIIKQIEDWENGFFYYFIKCVLIHYETGKIVAEGIGSCNSKESKYRWRWVTEKELPAGIDKSMLQKKVMQGQYGSYTLYRIENDDIYSIVNTIQKMAKKRALIDAVLSACRLSSVFTQDIEEEHISNGNGITNEATTLPQQKAQPSQSQVKQNQPQQKPVQAQSNQATSTPQAQSAIPTSKELLALKAKLLEAGYSDQEARKILSSIKTKEQLAQTLAQIMNTANEQNVEQESIQQPEDDIPEAETIEEPF